MQWINSSGVSIALWTRAARLAWFGNVQFHPCEHSGSPFPMFLQGRYVGTKRCIPRRSRVHSETFHVSPRECNRIISIVKCFKSINLKLTFVKMANSFDLYHYLALNRYRSCPPKTKDVITQSCSWKNFFSVPSFLVLFGRFALPIPQELKSSCSADWSRTGKRLAELCIHIVMYPDSEH